MPCWRITFELSGRVPHGQARSARTMTRRRGARLALLPHGPLERLVMCHLELIPCEVKGAVKDAENGDVAVISDEVGDAVVAIQENANIPRRSPVPVPDLREFPEQLGPIENSLNRPRCRLRIIGGNVFVNVLEPALCF